MLKLTASHEPISRPIDRPLPRLLLAVLVVASCGTSIAIADQRISLFDIAVAAIGSLAAMKLLSSLEFRSAHIEPLALASAFLALNLALSPTLDAVIVGGGPLVGVLTLFAVEQLNPQQFPWRAFAIALGLNVLVALSQLSATPRPSGLSRFANELAFVGAIAVLIGLHAPFQTSRTMRTIVTVLGVASTVLSGGRTSSLAIAFLFLAALFRYRRRPVELFLGCVAILVGLWQFLELNPTARGAVDAVSQRFSRGIELVQSDLTSFFYVENWLAASAKAADSFPFGAGAEDAVVESSSFEGDFIVHNTPLAILLTSGILGFYLVIKLLSWFGHRIVENCGRPLAIVFAMSLLPRLAFGYLLNSRLLWLTIVLFAVVPFDHTRPRPGDS